MLRKLKGSAGDLTFKTVNGQTVVSEKVVNVKNMRTTAQQKHRMKWANVIQMYKGIAPLLNYGFETKTKGTSDYNMFVHVNMQLQPVYLPKSFVAGGACIVAPYQITQGSLPSIVVTGEGADRVTDISLGSLTIDESTTVADFSNAVVQNNADYNYGDQISYFTILQRINAATQIPYGVFQASNIVLDKGSKSPVWALAHEAGFTTKNGFLAHGADEGDGAYCWVHSRKAAGKTLVSSQLLLDNNSILPDYTSDQAYADAVATYGGENNVFLIPDKVTGSVSNSGSTSGGSSSGGGDNTGGGDGSDPLA